MSGFSNNNGGAAGTATLSTSMTWTLLSSDGLQAIPGGTVTTLAPGEIADVAVTINMIQQGGGANSSAWWQRKFFGVQNVSGALFGADGGTTDQAIDSVVGSAISTATAKLVIVGTSIVAQASRPTGVNCYVSVTIDYVRGIPPISVLAPTLDARTVPLMAGASGTGQPFTITGTNLLNCVASIGGISATVNSSTSNSITITSPALTATATPYDIVITNNAGSATLRGSIYVVPASFVRVWYAGMTATASSWTDILAGTVASQAVTSKQPAINAAWGANSQPALTGSVVGNTSMTVSSSFTLAQPYTVVLMCDSTSYASGQQYFGDNGITGSTNSISVQRDAATGNSYTVGSIRVAGTATWGSPTSFFLAGDSANTDTNCYRNGSPLRFGEALGTANFTGMTLFNSVAGSQAINGNIGLYAIANQNLVQFSGFQTDATIMRNILIAIYGAG